MNIISTTSKSLSLSLDIELTNNIADYRKSLGGQSPRYFHCWWQSLLVILTYKNKMTIDEAFKKLSLIGLYYNKNHTNLIRRAINGKKPDPVRREYSKSLKDIVSECGLNGCGGKLNRTTYQIPYNLWYDDRVEARSILITKFKCLLPLFLELDDKWKKIQ